VPAKLASPHWCAGLRKKTVLCLDEIQATPNAIQALRYFYEETPELFLISAGYLLEFALAEHHFSMPVGRFLIKS